MTQTILLSNDPSIHLIRTDCPDVRQRGDISRLVTICQQHDNISVSCPLDPEDAAIYFLLYQTSGTICSLVSVLSLLPDHADTVECSAFTHPGHRHQGFFSELLEHALEWVGERDILFLVSGQCPDTLAVLESLEAEPVSEELQMELDIHAVSTLGRESCQTSICRIPHHPDLQLTSCIDKEQGLQEWVLSKRSSFLQTLGSCQTSVLSDTAVCLHHVEILPQFRGCGYGTILIQQLILALKEQGFSKIILQVSGDNSAALALYKKQGFRITETLSFYLY